jgi:hypothetical protein
MLTYAGVYVCLRVQVAERAADLIKEALASSSSSS